LLNFVLDVKSGDQEK